MFTLPLLFLHFANRVDIRRYNHLIEGHPLLARLVWEPKLGHKPLDRLLPIRCRRRFRFLPPREGSAAPPLHRLISGWAEPESVTMGQPLRRSPRARSTNPETFQPPRRIAFRELRLNTLTRE